MSDPTAADSPHICEHAVDESRSLTANLKQTFRELEWLNRSFGSVHVLVASRRFTLMPLEYFEDDQAATVFHHNHPQRDNELVLYNILKADNVVVLFGVDASAHAFLRGHYPAAKFYSQAAALLEHFSSENLAAGNRRLYAHLRRDSLDVFAYEKNHLLLANSYECRHTADCIYYLLYVWKQLGFEQESDELHLSGDLRDKDQLLTDLRRYLRQVFVMNPATNLDLQAVT